MRRADVETSLRHAGGVKRYHAWPTVQTQTVADHSWHVARIYREIWSDDMPSEVWEYILYHDVAELGTGDIPFGAKSPAMREILSEVEGDVLQNLGVVLPELNPDQKVRVKLADLLEMWEFGLEETRRGNQYGEPICRSVYYEICQKVKDDTELQLDVDNWMRSRKNG